MRATPPARTMGSLRMRPRVAETSAAGERDGYDSARRSAKSVHDHVDRRGPRGEAFAYSPTRPQAIGTARIGDRPRIGDRVRLTRLQHVRIKDRAAARQLAQKEHALAEIGRAHV